MADNGTRALPSLPPRLKVLLATLGLAGCGLVYFSTSRYGAGLSPDSVGYVAVARNLAAGRGLVSYQETPFVEQGPIYPLVLGFIDCTLGIDPVSSANVVNAGAFGLVVFLSGVLMFRYFAASPLFAWLGVLFVIASRPLFEVSVMAWSEPVFIVLVLVFLSLLGSFLNKQRLRVLVFLSLAATLACLTRYVGVTLILSGAAALFLLCPSRETNRLKTCCIFLAISGLPVTAYLVRNHIVSGAFAGSRGASKYSLVENVAFTLRAILEWFLPRSVVEQKPAFVVLSGVLALGICGVVVGLGSWYLQHPSGKDNLTFRDLAVVVPFAATYVVFLVTSSTLIAYNTIDGRLLSPIYVPVVLVSLSVVHVVSGRVKGLKWGGVAQCALAGSVILLLFYRFVSVGFAASECLKEGAGGYSSRSWRNSDIARYLQNARLEPEYRFYSNSPDALYLFSGASATLSPESKRHDLEDSERANDLSAIPGAWPRDRAAYLVWFYKVNREGLLSIGELQKVADISRLRGFVDGEICMVTRRGAR